MWGRLAEVRRATHRPRATHRRLLGRLWVQPWSVQLRCNAKIDRTKGGKYFRGLNEEKTTCNAGVIVLLYDRDVFMSMLTMQDKAQIYTFHFHRPLVPGMACARRWAKLAAHSLSFSLALRSLTFSCSNMYCTSSAEEEDDKMKRKGKVWTSAAHIFLSGQRNCGLTWLGVFSDRVASADNGALQDLKSLQEATALGFCRL